ncbi:hypothetical protein F4780DRAFT_784063 [Xylariomycetidae sp. FL0641]|nr:hypothetical protein F4780DRAFT_784063 [Xylariomycetidae sp. FL0641]
MRYIPGHTHRYKWAQWRRLWENNLPDLATLRHRAKTASFLAIDLEPWNRNEGEFAEIGLAFIPSASHQSPFSLRNCTPRTWANVVEQFRVRSRCFRVEEHKQGTCRPREKYLYGQVEYIKRTEVEDALMQAITSFKADSDLYSEMVLIGFDMSFEFRALSAILPRLHTQFSSWMDLQEIAAMASEATRPGEQPGLRDTLMALGFDEDCKRWQGVRNAHCSGNDATRMASMLMGLLDLQGTDKLEIPRQTLSFRKLPWMPNSKHRYYSHLFKVRPYPPELYPFAARLRIAGGMTGFTARSFFAYFAAYSPTAAGFRTCQGRAVTGWICLQTLEDLRNFVSEVDGKEVDARSERVWIAAKDIRSTGEVAPSVEEYRQEKRRVMDAAREGKRRERSQKQKQLQDITDDFGGLSLELISNVLLSNLSQLTITILYNSMRSSCSRYFISLPLRYGVPLFISAGLVHWLFSQSLLLARGTAMGMGRCAFTTAGEFGSPKADHLYR